MTEHNHDHDHEHNHEAEYITLVDEEGNESLYEILFTFDSDEFNKSYVVLYPAGTLDEEDVELQAYAYEEEDEGGSGQLMPIETEAEWDMVEEVLNTFLDEEDEEEEA